MRVARPVLCLALVGSLTAAGAASAATKPKPKPKPKPVPPVCNLVTDDAGDANGSAFKAGVFPTSEDAVDIVSGDVASDAKTLTTVIRVKKLATSSATSPGGLHWKFWFTLGDQKFFTQAVADTAFGVSYSYGTIDPTTGSSKGLGDAVGVLDTAKNEVRVSIPTGGLPVPVKLGTKVTSFELSTGRFVDAGVTFSDSTDAATGSKSYTSGAKSCVTPGK